jgi:hypothetical protein
MKSIIITESEEHTKNNTVVSSMAVIYITTFKHLKALTIYNVLSNQRHNNYLK